MSPTSRTPSTKAPVTERLGVTEERVGKSGRFAEAAGTAGAAAAVSFSYPGVALRVCFRGQRVRVRARSSTGKSRMLAQLDGAPLEDVTVPNSTTEFELWHGPDDGRIHCLDWIHMTESWIGIVSVTEFLIDGEVHAPTPFPSRQILLVGDSITCGHGAAEGRSADCKQNPSWWSAVSSYGAVLGRLLSAESEQVCFGGRGLVRDWQGKTDTLTAPEFFEQAIPKVRDPVPWNLKNSHPDVVIVGLGTNDFGVGAPEPESYISAYLAFLARIRSVYPQAQIFLTEGPMMSDPEADAVAAEDTLQEYIAETVKRAADPRVHAATVTHQPGDKCDPHPTAEQHRVMAEELARLIRPVLNW